MCVRARVCACGHLHGGGGGIIIIIFIITHDDHTIFCIKLAFRFVTGLVHEATVGVGDIDRQHIVGADVFQTSDILDAAPAVDGLDTSRSQYYTKIEKRNIHLLYFFKHDNVMLC